jgi:hypothetical protein
MKSTAMRESFAKLEARWKTNRKKLAIQTLRELGAIVIDPLEDINEDLAQIAGFQNQIFLLNQPGIAPQFSSEIDQSSDASTNREYRELPSKAELREQITKIVNSDIATNRELVFKKTNKSPNPESSNKSDRLQAGQNPNQENMKLQMLLIQQRNNRLNRNLLGQPFGSPSIGLDITFGTQWMGNTGDFSTLDDIGEIDNIAFIERKVSSDLLIKLSEITSMSKLSFESCNIDVDNIANKQWGNLTSLELKNTAVELTLIQAFASIKSLISLEFVNCKIAKGTLISLGEFKNIRSLMFKDTEVDSTVLNSIETLKNIKYLNLSACKFSTESYLAKLFLEFAEHRSGLGAQ